MDVSVMIENVKFNYRVAAIVRNGNKILLHKSKTDDFYAIPGGRIKIGEDSKSALKREFYEEMGVNITINKYLGTIENFFEYNNKQYHELMIVHEVEFEKGSAYYQQEKIVGLENEGKLEFIWKSVDEIKDLELKPKFLKECIVKDVEFSHLINKT